ncbi:MAG: hypothetical protein WHS46_03240 [Desulfosoma sp.]
MSRNCRLLAMIGALVMALWLKAQAQGMPLPQGQQGFSYVPTANPIVAADPAVARPIGVGPVAEGGPTVRLRISLAAFGGPVDLYVGIIAPALDPFHLYLVNPDGQLLVFETELVAWKRSVKQPVDAFLFGDIPVSALPPGQYHCYLMATPTGDSTRYYLWHTYFVVRDSVGGCGVYNGRRSFTMTYDHLYTADFEGFHQELRWEGVVPFVLREDNTISGEGTVTNSTVFYAHDVYCWGSTHAHVKLSGHLYFDENCQAMLRIDFDEEIDSVPLICSPGGGGILPGGRNNYTLYFPVRDGATVSGPPMGPGLTGSSNYILHIVP